MITKSNIENSKGTILLIHGTASQNIDGQLPAEEVQKKIIKTDPNHYIIHPTYKELASRLNSLGWDTFRYTRVGVYQNHVDLNEYATTDLSTITGQLNNIWSAMPKDRPRIIFAWSGGSIHALQLPLSEADAVIILGGISTKRIDVYRLQAKTEKERQEIERDIDNLLAQEGNSNGTEMLGYDMPKKRFWDENRLQDNWTYLKPYANLPVLILHGDSDKECSITQAKVWKEKLPNHNITLEIKQSGNHAFGTIGNQPDMLDLATAMDLFLSRVVSPTASA
ncbi:MAG: hypothetical protein HQK52_16855 [Oligoflexia bacterium]|nr:hypothetical protein [Oligoflexia bacterium]